MQDLRDSVRWRLHDHWAVDGLPPFITYLPADDAWALHAYGHTQAASRRLDVLAACLRCERAEPGFIRRILDTREDARLMSLTPDLAAAERQRAGIERQRAAQAAADRAAQAARIAAMKRPERLDLDDFL